jgi:hypothetical protein
VGIVCLYDTESYAGSSVATGRATHARQVEGDDRDRKGYPVTPGWGLGMRLITPTHKNKLLWNLHKEARDYQWL